MAKPARPMPIETMVEMYNSGKTTVQIAAILGSKEWQSYWIANTGAEWMPHKVTVTVALKRAGCKMRTSSERAFGRHPAKKPWPLDQMKYWYSDGMTLEEIATVLSSDQWQPYWIEKIGTEYRPGVKIVNKVLKKQMKLRSTGAPAGRNVFWVGGVIVDGSGYVLIHNPHHPFANTGGYVREHRMVMEESLGRYLDPQEVVHHKDENKQNNSPGNLVLYPCSADHLRYGHQEMKRRYGIGDHRRAIQNARDNWWPQDLLRKWYVDSLLTASAIAKMVGRTIPETNRGLSVVCRLQMDGNSSRRWVPTEDEVEQALEFLATAPVYPEHDVRRSLEQPRHSIDQFHKDARHRMDAAFPPSQ